MIALDLAAGMLEKSRGNDSADEYVLADIEHIPLPDGSVDLCFSNLAIQWCSSLHAALAEMHRVVKPGGKVVFLLWLRGRLLSSLRLGSKLMEKHIPTSFSRLRR